jgi:hypothetical protein
VEDNIKVDLKEEKSWSVDWIQLAEGTDLWRALISTAMNVLVP